MTEPYTIPMDGIQCGRCGQPALHTVVGARSRHTVHLDPHIRPCPAPNPAPEVTP